MGLGRPSPATAISGVALFVALGGTGYALVQSAVPDRAGVFHGCVNRANGALRVVEKAGDCRRRSKKRPGEFAIAWNQRGPAGAAGANGADGAKGADGARGADGVNGVNGADGTSVVARLRSTAEVTTTNTAQTVAMNPSSWTQGATDTDQLLGEVTYDPPPSSDCSQDIGGFPATATATVTVKADGTVLGAASVFPSAESSVTTPITLGSLFEPGAATPRNVVVEVSDTCGLGGGAGAHATTRFQIKAVKVNVLAAR